jgi:transposase
MVSMETYSMDLRDRVVAACDSGRWKRVEIAEQFGVSASWIRRLLQRRRETGDYGAKRTKRGRKPAFSGKSLKQLDRLAQEQPDATLEELRDRCGVSCSLETVSNTLARLGYRRKKRRSGRLSKTVLT